MSMPGFRVPGCRAAFDNEDTFARLKKAEGYEIVCGFLTFRRINSWVMDGATLPAVDSILAETVKDPVGPEFMAPPAGLG